MDYSTFLEEDFEENERFSQRIIDELTPEKASSELNKNVYEINGIPVEFPYSAYESQRLMMRDIITALQNCENSLLESPTGTGKTAAILCGLLAWQKETEGKWKIGEGWPCQIDKATFSAKCTCGFNQDPKNQKVILVSVKEKFHDVVVLQRYSYAYVDQDIPEVNGQNSGTAYPLPSPKKRKILQLKKTPDDTRGQADLCRFCILTYYQQNSVPVIYYATRTVSQVKQVIKELKNTSYSKGIQMTILASRSHTCLNLDVRKTKNINDKCHKFRKNHWRNVQTNMNTNMKTCDRFCPSNNQETFEEFSQGQATAWDIEDLQKYSGRKLGCPYYGTKILKEKAKIVFCTYNHLLQGGIRDVMNIDLTNNVLVFDEAHNIEDICREISSIVIKEKYINSSVIPEIEKALENPKSIPKNISPILNGFLDLFRNLSSWFVNHSQNIIFDYEKKKEEYIKFSNSELATQLKKVGFTLEQLIDYENYLETLKDAADGKIDKESDNPEDDETVNFKFSITIIRNISSLFWKLKFMLGGYGNRRTGNISEHFRATFIKKVTAVIKNSKGVRKYIFENEFQNICLNPALAFEPLKNRARSIIVASGTLSPLHSFQSELGTPFPLKLSAPHVISQNNIVSAVVTKGPNGIDLCFDKKGQGQLENQIELGHCLVKICNDVPHGVLIFLPSYNWMEELKTVWKKLPEDNTIMNQLESLKTVFFEESQDKELFLQNMKNYTKMITSSPKGCVLFAVFRGKVSEGIDFKDEQARAVVTVGIPFGNPTNPSILFKKEYNDAVNAQKTSRRLLNGTEWYKTQTFRSMNQAFGRCVRHKDDWGSFVIIESRMRFGYHKSKLSSWVSEKMKICESFKELEDYLKDLVRFKSNETEIVTEEELNDEEGKLNTITANRNEDVEWLPDEDDELFLSLDTMEGVSVTNTQSPATVVAQALRDSGLNSPKRSLKY